MKLAVPVTCYRCGGAGRLEWSYVSRERNGFYSVSEPKPCAVCNGTGKIR